MENATVSTFFENLTSLFRSETPNVKNVYRIKEISTSTTEEPLQDVTLTESYKTFSGETTTELEENFEPKLNISEDEGVSNIYSLFDEPSFQTTTEAEATLDLAEDYTTTIVYNILNFTENSSHNNATEVSVEKHLNFTEMHLTEMLNVTDGPISTEAFDQFRTTELPVYTNFTNSQESFKATELPDYFTITELPKSSTVTDISDYFSSTELTDTKVPEHMTTIEFLESYNVTESPSLASITELSEYSHVTELPAYANVTELSEYSSSRDPLEYSNSTGFSKAFDLLDIYSTPETSSLSDVGDFNTATDTVNSSTGFSNIFRLKDPRSTTEFLSSFSWSNVTNWANNRSTTGSDYITDAVTTFFNGNGTSLVDSIAPTDSIFQGHNYSLDATVPAYVPDILNTTVGGLTTVINDSLPLSVSHYTHGFEMISILAILLIIIIVTATTGNILVLATITTNPKMKTRTHMFLLNLAIADLIMALLVVPFSLITLLEGGWVFGDVMCHLNGFLTGLSAHASCHLLMYISIHKCITLTSPYTEMSLGSVYTMLVAAWLWPVVYNMAAVMGWTEIVYKVGALQCGPVVPSSRAQTLHSVVNTVCNEAVPFFILVFCYARIFCYVSSISKKVKVCLPDPRDKAARVEQQKQMLYTLLVILLCFLLCWTPYLVYSVKIQQYPPNEAPTWLRVLNPIAYLFGYLNSACNPIIYALRSSTFWESYKRILCCWKGNRQKMKNEENGHLRNAKKREAISSKFNGIRPTIELVRDEKPTAATSNDEEYELTEDFSLLSGHSNLQGSIERELWKRGLDLSFISENPNKSKKPKSRHHSRVADMFHRIKRRNDKSSMSRCNSGEWSPTKTISPYRSYESLEGEEIPKVRDLKDRRKSDVNVGSSEAELQAFEKLKKRDHGSSKLSLSRAGCSSRSTDSLSKDKHQNIPLQVWVLRDNVV